jgi:hypothetical protein
MMGYHHWQAYYSSPEDCTDRREDETMATLKKGDRAPGFALPNQEGAIVRLSDFKGRKLLVYFYPKAGTAG